MSKQGDQHKRKEAKAKRRAKRKKQSEFQKSLRIIDGADRMQTLWGRMRRG